MDNQKEFFEEVFRANKDRVYRLCCVYAADPEIRKDLMQDVFIRVWEHLGTFRGESAMSTWIYRIALNTCLTHVRSLKISKVQSNIPSDFDLEDEPDCANQEERLSCFLKCAHQLPAFDRTLLSLFLEDLSGKEIAQITGLSESNVRVRLHRIKEKLTVMINQLTEKEISYEL